MHESLFLCWLETDYLAVQRESEHPYHCLVFKLRAVAIAFLVTIDPLLQQNDLIEWARGAKEVRPYLSNEVDHFLRPWRKQRAIGLALCGVSQDGLEQSCDTRLGVRNPFLGISEVGKVK